MASPKEKNDKDLAKAASMRKRSIALASAVYKRQLDGILKEFPELIIPTLNHCKRLKAKNTETDVGFVVDGTSLGSVKSERVEDETEQQAPGVVKLCPDALKDAPQDSPMAPKAQLAAEEALDRAIDRQTTKLSNLPVCDLKTICIYLQPIAFSLFNLRAIAVRGNRTVAQEKHCELIEFDTGVAGYVLLERRFQTVRSLAEYLKVFQEKRGDRGSQLRLPPDWEKCGVYCIVEHGDELHIQHRFSKKVAKLPECYQTKAAEINIINNFSDERAEIRLNGHLTGENLATLMLAAGDRRLLTRALSDINDEASMRPRKAAKKESGQTQANQGVTLMAEPVLPPQSGEGVDGEVSAGSSPFDGGASAAEVPPKPRRLPGKTTVVAKTEGGDVAEFERDFIPPEPSTS